MKVLVNVYTKDQCNIGAKVILTSKTHKWLLLNT
jgi:hypothetical protein